MRLPDPIEREIKAIETEYDQRPGQHAGSAKLRGLRWAVEDVLRQFGVTYRNWKELQVDKQ